MATVGHRFVHGGPSLAEPVVIDDTIRAELGSLTELAPLHHRRAIDALDAARAALPGVPHIACFDTAFHADLPQAAATYAVPRAWRDRWNLRKYGFHGLSHASVARQVPELLQRPRDTVRIVSAHLGAGASLCAIDGGRSVDTTMGFTPLDGLVMATRCGSVDPGMLLWLLREDRLDLESLSDGLERRSGLAGLSELPHRASDMRAVRQAAERGDQRARLAVDVYVHRLRAGIAAMAAAMNGMDVLAFTGGIGEHDAVLRNDVTNGLRFLGVAIDKVSNAHCLPGTDISAPGGSTRVVVVAAEEDIEVARHARAAAIETLVACRDRPSTMPDRPVTVGPRPLPGTPPPLTGSSV
ncbi:acetate/propionate family kinase [Haloechinothrix sp. LS1_15]|uniref:acetate/propionate family kinase n=1 Tax=Haloechinothrix sp. LS1_15 TaxID=2652248 RepID=UPI00294B2D34|nr:acetate/propionate family kinase [Haloechinothrix sp. LS1_15]